jgi:hypothetical protein
LLLLLYLHLSTRGRAVPGVRVDGAMIKLAFVSMGIAFLLLESKSITQFSLLFGTTWVNNSLVFLAVLLAVLGANWAASRLSGGHRVIWTVYLLLLLSCGASLVFPLGGLLAVGSPRMRFVLASLLTFAPLFFADLIFSLEFRDRAVPEHVFGWNLLGSTIGGVVEYASMSCGYNLLAVLVALFYTVAFLLMGLSWSSGGAGRDGSRPYGRSTAGFWRRP